MTDPATPAATTVVNPDPTVGQMVTIIRYLTILIGGASAIMGLISKHDIAGLVAYLQSNALVSVLGAVLALATAAYGLWDKLKTHKVLVAAAPTADNLTLKGS